MNSTKFLMGLVVALLIAILGMQYAQMHKSAQDEPEAVVTEQDELVLEQEARGGELMSGAEAEVERDALLMAEIEQMRRDMERLQGTNQNMEQELAVSSEEMQRMEMELRRNQRMHEARLREITEAP